LLSYLQIELVKLCAFSPASVIRNDMPFEMCGARSSFS
jgi:hypothetical protein